MEIVIRRALAVGDSTLGLIALKSHSLAIWTLEDQVRETTRDLSISAEDWVKSWKVGKRTAIPRGRYELVLSFSPRFGKILPELKEVPGFSNIRIHTGNTTEDTDGCILLGLRKSVGTVLDSRVAMDRFLAEITTPDLKLKERTWVTID